MTAGLISADINSAWTLSVCDGAPATVDQVSVIVGFHLPEADASR